VSAAPTSRIPLRGLEWGVIVAVFTSVGTSIFSAGILYADVRAMDRRLTTVEGNIKEMPAKLGSVDSRLSGIEAKLEFLVDQYRDSRNGGAR